MTAHAIDPGDDNHTPEARALHALRNALSVLVMATHDGTVQRATMREVITERVVPELDRVADLFQRQERTIEEQRAELLRLNRFADRAEARDTKNQQQLIAAHDVIRSFGHALDGLVPLLEKLVAEHRDLHDEPLTRAEILRRHPNDPVMSGAKADDAHTLR